MNKEITELDCEDGYEALSYACKNDNVDLVRYILENGNLADRKKIETELKEILFMKVVRSNAIRVCKLFISEFLFNKKELKRLVDFADEAHNAEIKILLEDELTKKHARFEIDEVETRTIRFLEAGEPGFLPSHHTGGEKMKYKPEIEIALKKDKK